MSNLKIEKKIDDPSGRQQQEEEEEEEGEEDSSEYAESVLGFLHEPTVDFVNEVCDTEEERHRAMKSICRMFASLESDAARDLEEFEASIPENSQEWTQEMWEYMYEKEQEEVRNFEEQQLALQKKKRIQKRLDKTFRRRRKIAKKTSKRERQSSSGLA
ncbi:protein pxr1-like isoform X2 [Prunus avium]|uniref:Protein pxr1-like isoform X2 n=1 Tax=Prunus avium TaxID=42229 RepID=A0A6P5SKF3_PRUAV|nr:protein pxr1-like isoform X2 [Prunus avium]